MAARCEYYWRKTSGLAIKCMKCCSEINNGSSGERFSMLFVIVPGNPGCIKFYERFSEVLVDNTNIPVWGISHTGHAMSEYGVRHPAVEQCGLQEQIEHKIQYLNEEVFPATDKVVLIGHSIGCYIILQILDRMRSSEQKFFKSILLFPTIERMRVSPQGRTMTPALDYGRWAFVYLSGLLAWMPRFMRDWLISSFVRVILRDDDIIKRYVDKIIFYYGESDGWCPLSYYEEVKKLYSSYEGSTVLLCDKKIPHAFVIDRSEDMAEIVARITCT